MTKEHEQRIPADVRSAVLGAVTPAMKQTMVPINSAVLSSAPSYSEVLDFCERVWRATLLPMAAFGEGDLSLYGYSHERGYARMNADKKVFLTSAGLDFLRHAGVISPGPQIVCCVCGRSPVARMAPPLCAVCDQAPINSGPQPLRVRGVGRVADEPRAILLMLSDIPSDDQMRDLHEFMREWRAS